MSLLIAPLMAAMAFSSLAAAVESDKYTFEHQVSVSAHYLQYDDTQDLDMPVLSGGYGYQITTPDKNLSFTPEVRVAVGRTNYYGEDVTLSSVQAAVRMTANVNKSVGFFIRPNYTLSKYTLDGGSTPSDTEFDIAYGASIKLNKTLNLDFSVEHFEDSKAYGIGVRVPM